MTKSILSRTRTPAVWWERIKKNRLMVRALILDYWNEMGYITDEERMYLGVR